MKRVKLIKPCDVKDMNGNTVHYAAGTEFLLKYFSYDAIDENGEVYVVPEAMVEDGKLRGILFSEDGTELTPDKCTIGQRWAELSFLDNTMNFSVTADYIEETKCEIISIS